MVSVSGYRFVVPLASAVCPLVGQVVPGVCAGFLVGGTGAYSWWVELGLVPLVGRATSRGVFRGSCGLMTLDSLPAIGGAVFPLCWLFGLRWPSTET